MNYKLTITTDQLTASGFSDLAKRIRKEYGERFDAANGDFTVESTVATVNVMFLDVAKGDVVDFTEDLQGYEPEVTFDFQLSKSLSGKTWFPTDLYEDDE